MEILPLHDLQQFFHIHSAFCVQPEFFTKLAHAEGPYSSAVQLVIPARYRKVFEIPEFFGKISIREKSFAGNVIHK